MSTVRCVKIQNKVRLSTFSLHKPPMPSTPARAEFRARYLVESSVALARVAETIAGHLMLRFGRIPRKGERWKGRFADFVIEEATPTAIRRIKMILPVSPVAPERREAH